MVEDAEYQYIVPSYAYGDSAHRRREGAMLTSKVVAYRLLDMNTCFILLSYDARACVKLEVFTPFSNAPTAFSFPPKDVTTNLVLVTNGLSITHGARTNLVRATDLQ